MFLNVKQTAVSLLFALALAALGGCDNDLQINADPKPIYAVYAVLDPTEETQVVRLSRAFLTEGDAVEYARDNNLSVPEAVVTATATKADGQTITLNFTPTDTMKAEGDFERSATVFVSSDSLVAGLTYTLNITAPGLDGGEAVTITGQTVVPDKPQFVRPDNTRLSSSNPDNPDLVGTPLEGYPLAFFDSDGYDVQFLKSNVRASEDQRPGAAFEMRIRFTYWRDDAPEEILHLQFGPSELIENSNVGCNVTGAICYETGRDFQTFLIQELNTGENENVAYAYADSLMDQSVEIEITAVDQELVNYMDVNNPAFEDFTTLRPEYTNLDGNAIGIFGARNRASAWVRLTPCTKFLAGLNNEPRPETVCE